MKCFERDLINEVVQVEVGERERWSVYEAEKLASLVSEGRRRRRRRSGKAVLSTFCVSLSWGLYDTHLVLM